MDNKEEQMSATSNAGIQMQIQQQRQTHMLNQARRQSPHQYHRFDHGRVVAPGQGGSRMQALPNMGQIGVSSPYGYVASVRRRAEPYIRAMHCERFGGLNAPIGVGNAISDHNEIVQQLQQLTVSPTQLQSGAPTVGQPDLQQATQEPAAGGSTQSEHRKLIQQQLVLLLHAYKCQIQERQANGEARICALPHCKTMKNVLTHMTTCEEGIGCTLPLCYSSRQIIADWKQCQKRDCPVCLPLKQADKNKAANSRAAVVVSTNQQASTTGSTSAVAAVAATANPQQQAVNMFPGCLRPAQVTKEWHRSVTPDLRDDIIRKIFRSVIPVPDPNLMFDKRLHNIVTYARKVEGDMYEIANSRSEYYRLVAEKIYKVQKELEEARQKRIEITSTQ